MKPKTARRLFLLGIWLGIILLVCCGAACVLSRAAEPFITLPGWLPLIFVISLVMFWSSLYGHSWVKRKTMWLDKGFAVITIQGKGCLREIVTNPREEWMSYWNPDDYVVKADDVTAVAKIQYTIEGKPFLFNLTVTGKFSHSDALTKFAPFLLDPWHIDRCIIEKVQDIFFDVVSKKGFADYKHFVHPESKVEQEAFFVLIKRDLHSALQDAGLQLTTAKFSD